MMSRTDIMEGEDGDGDVVETVEQWKVGRSNAGG